MVGGPRGAGPAAQGPCGQHEVDLARRVPRHLLTARLPLGIGVPLQHSNNQNHFWTPVKRDTTIQPLVPHVNAYSYGTLMRNYRCDSRLTDCYDRRGTERVRASQEMVPPAQRFRINLASRSRKPTTLQRALREESTRQTNAKGLAAVESLDHGKSMMLSRDDVGADVDAGEAPVQITSNDILRNVWRVPPTDKQVTISQPYLPKSV